ncbi:hypothetical protein K2P96_00830 [Patescibacteria group bacterium]|nr:hypothetical protein [Patescibacteria group bacterium]
MEDNNMTKRNFLLFIIVLVIIIGAFYGYLYLRNSTPKISPGGGSGTNFVSEFNPFGQSNTNNGSENNPNNGNENQGTGEPIITEAKKLNKVSSMPVAGFSVYQKERYKEIAASPEPATTDIPATTTIKTATKPTPPPTEFVPALRYVARSNGNIYETFADKLDERQFTNTVIPKIYEAFFGSKAEQVVMRYLKTDEKTISTFTGGLPKEILGGDTSLDTKITGSFLPDNITDLSVAPDGTKIFYLLNSNGGVVGITAGTLGDKKVQVFDSPFTEWLSQWPTAKMLTLTTKPSSRVEGYMYAINTDKKDFVRILGGINGLTTLTSPNGKLVLYGDENLNLNIYNIETGETTPIPPKTMPEKCVWNKTSSTIYCSVPNSLGVGIYPDDWYKGEASFTDQIWKLDVATGNGNLILDPQSLTEGYLIDGVKPVLDDGENYLFFVNKKDSMLWELKLN